MATVVLVASLMCVTPPGQARATVPVGYGQRGVNIVTLMTQAVTIKDHPELAGYGEPQSTYTKLASYGHKLIRLNISWDYLQPGIAEGNLEFFEPYMTVIRAEVAKIKAAGMRVVIDLHNGCEWTKPGTTTTLVCGAGLTTAITNDVWRKLSTAFKDEPAVYAYDLFNEPVRFDHPTRANVRVPGNQPYETYKTHVNQVVKAIRDNGDSTTIWVEPLCCYWFFDFDDTDPAGGWVNDPLNKIVYSQHMYPVLDSTNGEPYNPEKLDPNYEVPKGSIFADRGYTWGFLWRLDNFGNWCNAHNLKCSIGEVGWYGDYNQTPASAAGWNTLADDWYWKADYYGLDVTYFGVNTADRQPLLAYDAPGGPPWYPASGISMKRPQATIIEKPGHLSKP
ncbi:cellulase family glycosylhydrolase [Mycobacteroides sp. CBMA 326]|uniref:glycoside hydrolase family 5 protein n=1 Tax=Mycobacteroides sp. CBMA 326 TaxID=1904945 RepID=UPI0028154B46|nr:cellulase family glycosylhydrolase [Mycobacteroides sp. CBMA 326]